MDMVTVLLKHRACVNNEDEVRTEIYTVCIDRTIRHVLKNGY